MKIGSIKRKSLRDPKEKHSICGLITLDPSLDFFP
jgi:hypothetical protein